MKKNQMPLTLKETIVLDGEYGLKELRSLSFEPSVSITEHEDHVLIEGSLHLAGEGMASISSRFDEEVLQSYERIQVINRTSEEELEFEHYFPITVNVAANRVANVHLLDVYIDHIDYELKDDRILFIHADIVVDGVANVEAPVVVEEPKPRLDPVDVDNKKETLPDEEIHELPIRLLPNPFKEWNQPSGIEDEVEVEGRDNKDQQSEEDESSQEQLALEEEVVNQEDTIEPYVIDVPVQDEPVVELRATPPLESLVKHQSRTEEGQLDEEQTKENENLYENDDNYEDNSDDEEEHRDMTDDQALMGFVASLEETMTTIKIHITQQDETPEQIAERYGVSMILLMKKNQFESRAPFDRGRLVWIP